MNTKEAVAYILVEHNLTAYRFAQLIGALPQSVSQWQRNTRMSKAYADIVKTHFHIDVTDAV